MSVTPEPKPLGPTTEFVTVGRVLGAGPFAETGCPRDVATSPSGELIVVAGDLGWAQWHAWDAGVRSPSTRTCVS
ncbi:hypothetical protein LCL61_21290 [Amycolatopsis coloradensis]|uniref:Uncharacterized protein n=1 Tax=Amycolatopsis coloradensis TaxID=76021 RepID=A0ACD5BFC4_9PSEU